MRWPTTRRTAGRRRASREQTQECTVMVEEGEDADSRGQGQMGHSRLGVRSEVGEQWDRGQCLLVPNIGFNINIYRKYITASNRLRRSLEGGQAGGS